MIRIHEGYEIKPHREVPTSYIVVTTGRGGKIPNILSGLYTSPDYAKEAINKYLQTKKD
jgi:hypothetical protein